MPLLNRHLLYEGHTRRVAAVFAPEESVDDGRFSQSKRRAERHNFTQVSRSRAMPGDHIALPHDLAELVFQNVEVLAEVVMSKPDVQELAEVVTSKPELELAEVVTSKPELEELSKVVLFGPPVEPEEESPVDPVEPLLEPELALPLESELVSSPELVDVLGPDELADPLPEPVGGLVPLLVAVPDAASAVIIEELADADPVVTDSPDVSPSVAEAPSTGSVQLSAKAHPSRVLWPGRTGTLIPHGSPARGSGEDPRMAVVPWTALGCAKV